MDVSLLYFDGCPHWSVAEQRLGAALAEVGRGGVSVRHVLVETSEEAERLGFIGSPTILVNGKDPFATGAEQPAWACRVFKTPDGLAGSPTVEQLVEVLS
ncbi:thioredoxin family protein [Pedococcus sp. 5OH_020]|uniref:thioredoxin family protein n=1 Tax=Pedococcus sp. 5OH_020 TaxID=2989814 RepID=UPI0022E9EE17|nr:thioredoxin family protein [Pedococcus sp. 5OH_020]